MRDESDINVSGAAVMKVVVAIVAVVVAVVASFMLFENLDAKEIMVVQSPISGQLTWHTSAGVKMQGFGTVTKYPKREQFWFSAKNDQGTKENESIRCRFNDNGHAQISGSISWEMPLDETHLTALHTKYGSRSAVEQQLVRTVIEKSVYMTGPLMSSKESAAEKRTDLLRFIEEQVQRGVYLTETVQEKQPDAMTGQMKTVSVVRLRNDAAGQSLRAESSPLEVYAIKTSNLSINEVKYDETVEKQIQQQQQAMMQVQTAMARAKEAEQEAITVSKKGEAAAAEAKWKQEVIKAQAVTEAEQQYKVQTLNAERELKVAELNAKAAEQTKKQQILLGEGESSRAKANMAANGALETKLEALVEINKNYAEAIKEYKGNFVPNVVMGGNNGAHGTSSVMDLVNMFMVKTANDISLDMKTKQK